MSAEGGDESNDSYEKYHRSNEYLFFDKKENQKFQRKINIKSWLNKDQSRLLTI